MHERQRALAALIAEVRIEVGQLPADQHALVVERARGARGHIQPTSLGAQLADAPDHVQLALERILVLDRIRSPPAPGADEQLPDRGPAAARHLAGVLRPDRHVAPAQDALALRLHGVLEQLLQARARSGVLARQKAHQHAVGASGRKLEAGDGAQQLVGHLHQDPGAVARARVRARGAAVLEVLQSRDAQLDHLVRRRVIEPRDHAHAACVVLEARVVKSDCLGRLRGW